METVYIAGGCLWGVQHFFDSLPGVQMTEAVLKKDSICVIGNENMIKESAGLFENVEKLI